jgi:hypothetical protein
MLKRFLEHRDEVVARPHLLDVDEHLVVAEMLLEPVANATGVASSIRAAVADEKR